MEHRIHSSWSCCFTMSGMGADNLYFPGAADASGLRTRLGDLVDYSLGVVRVGSEIGKIEELGKHSCKKIPWILLLPNPFFFQARR